MEKQKPKLYIMIGLPGSGKSTWARNQKLEVISSDMIRKEIYDNEDVQDNPAEVFTIAKDRTQKYLALGKDVIFDATNISRKRRAEMFRRFGKTADLVAVYMAKHYETCILQNEERARKVPVHVIDRMYKQLEIPDWAEGWADIMIIGEETQQIFLPFHTKLFTEQEIYDNIYFSDIYNRDQRNPKYHIYTVSKHSWLVYKDVYKNNKDLPDRDRRMLCYAAALHDIGKAFCQEWNEEKERCTSYGHDRVGAQKAVAIMYNTMSVKDLIELGNLINNHIVIWSNKEMALSRVQNPELLVILNKADFMNKGVFYERE